MKKGQYNHFRKVSSTGLSAIKSVSRLLQTGLWLLIWSWQCVEMWSSEIKSGETVYLRLRDTPATSYRRFSVTFHEAQQYSQTDCYPVRMELNSDRLWKVTPMKGLWSDTLDIHLGNTTRQWCEGKPYKTIYGYNHLYNLYVSDSVLGVYWHRYIPAPTVAPTLFNGTVTESKVLDYCTARRDSFQYVLSMPSSIDSSSVYFFQWFRWDTDSWTRLDSLWIEKKTPIRSIATRLHEGLNDETYFCLIGSQFKVDKDKFCDFDISDINFTSSYEYTTGNINERGTHALVSSTRGIYKGINTDLFDHTQKDAKGYMLAVHCDETDSAVIWQQPFNEIVPNAEYMFSFWVMRWDENANDSIELELVVDGESQRQAFFVGQTHGRWQEVCLAWKAGNNSSASFSIVNRTQKVHGREIAIDDIMLRRKGDIRFLSKVSYDYLHIQKTSDTVVCCDTLLPYSWHGKSIKKRGVYYDTIRNDMGCDSVWCVLHFSIRHCCQDVYRNNDTLQICDTDIPYTWHDQTIHSEGQYYFYAKTVLDCDSIYDTLNAEIIHCKDCYYDLLYRKWENVIFVDNSRQQFIAYQWYHNNEPLIGETKQYYFNDDTLSGYYYVALTDTNHQTRNTCEYYFADLPFSAPLYQLTDEDEVVIYNHWGRMLYRGRPQQRRDLPAIFPPGIYIYLERKNGSTNIFKLVKTQ